MSDYQPAICGVCPYGCAVLVLCRDGKIIDVKADPDSLHGNLCPRGKSAPEVVHHEKRLLDPLIRNGPKGEPHFRKATWDKALDLISERMLAYKEKYGPNSLASYLGGGSLEDSLGDFGDDFFKHIGSINDFNCGSICFVSSRVLAPLTTLGITARRIRPDFNNSDVIFVWGTNPYSDSGKGRFHEIREARKRGAKIVVIDPRRSETAGIADLWISVLPGTDGALLLAMLKHLLEEDRYDQEFAADYTAGLPELKEYLQGLRTEDLLHMCGVSVADLKELMNFFCSSQAVSVTFYTGLEYQSSAVQGVRALYILWALGGKLDVKGGLLVEDGPYVVADEDTYQPDASPIGAGAYPLFAALTGKGQFIEFPHAVLQQEPYQIKSLLILGASPILSYPDPQLWEKVYRALDFLVVIDRFMPEEGRFADVILPATTYYENSSYYYYNDGIRLRRRVIPPVGEAKNDLFILQSIAERLGFGAALPKNDEELLKYTFADAPAQLKTLMEQTYGSIKTLKKPQYQKYKSGQLRWDGKPGFPTPSGKLEISSTLLKKYGYDPLPCYIHPYEEQGGKYPYYLTTGARSPYRYNSFGPDIASLNRKDKQASLDISLLDAERLDLKEGEMAQVKTKWGELTLPVHITSLHPGTVHIPVGGGNSFQPAGWKDKNVNQLCGTKVRDPISGYIVCKALQCHIEKIKGIEK